MDIHREHITFPVFLFGWRQVHRFMRRSAFHLNHTLALCMWLGIRSYLLYTERFVQLNARFHRVIPGFCVQARSSAVSRESNGIQKSKPQGAPLNSNTYLQSQFEILARYWSYCSGISRNPLQFWFHIWGVSLEINLNKAKRWESYLLSDSREVRPSRLKRAQGESLSMAQPSKMRLDLGGSGWW